MCFGHN
jgi:hypothetical protein